MQEYSKIIENTLNVVYDYEKDKIIRYHIEIAMLYWSELKNKQIVNLLGMNARYDILEANPKIKILSSDF